MSADGTSNPPPSSGTSQPERVRAELSPSYAPIDGRSPEELAAFAKTFAENLAFWSAENQFASNIDWADFFPSIESGDWAAAEARAAKEPQSALFLAFLKLYGYAQADLNGLTARRLNFYYQRVLRLQPLPSTPDQAHLIVQLKKTAGSTRIPIDYPFLTEDGAIYRSLHESFAHPATLDFIRTLAVDPKDASLHFAAIANSADGMGDELPEDAPSWHPFGYDRDLPHAAIGFALAAPILLLQEGDRVIQLTLELAFSGAAPNQAELEALFETDATIELSGKDDWLPVTRQTASVSVDGASASLTLTCDLDAEQDPVHPYDATKLEGGFETIAPILKLRFNDSANPRLTQALSASEIESIQLEVQVNGMKALHLENDHGRLDASKPFAPFGPLAKRASSFYIGAEEALTKNITAARIEIEWADAPEKLADRYSAYTDRNGTPIVASNDHFSADLQILRNGRFETLAPNRSLFDTDNANERITIDSTSRALSRGKFDLGLFERRYSRVVPQARYLLPFTTLRLFRPVNVASQPEVLRFRSSLRLPKTLARNYLAADTKNGFLRLRLNQSFLSEDYAQRYANAVTHNSLPDNKENQKEVPQLPYIPQIADFSFGYDAKTEKFNPNLINSTNTNAPDIEFFHLTPFGQRPENRTEKIRLNETDTRVRLLSPRDFQGQLILGVHGLEASQSLSLLFQVEDGSADPDVQRAEVHWSVLRSNHWLPLEDDAILYDTTNGFLTSGIVRLSLPSDTNTDNTLLEPGYVWIRAEIRERAAGANRLLSIHLNALATRRDEGTPNAETSAGLPPGVALEVDHTLSMIKSVEAPYGSFGGALAETPEDYYKRSSERLRHRGRAVSVWDYERLALQAFPNIYRAQCLPHTNRLLETEPGCVALVVIPDTRNKPAALALQPKVDAATIDQISQFLATLNSPFAEVAAINPRFEPLKLSFNVAFKPGFPFQPYREILDQDIKKYLAPWAFSTSVAPKFEGRFYRSELIAFIDGLEYVDYLTNFVMSRIAQTEATTKDSNVAEPSKPGAILTSADKHSILQVTS